LKPVHFIAIFVALGLIAALYFGGNTLKPKENKPAAAGPMAGGGTPGEMQAGMVDIPEPANFDTLLANAKMKLSPAAQAEISRQENTITRGDVKEQKVLALEALGKIWQNNKNRAIAAYYFAESGKLENSQKKLNFAAHLLSEEMHEEKNPNYKQWMATVAISSLQQSIALDPSDTTRIDLADIYINGTGETMKGIEQLLTIVRQDSTNIPANVILGRMAVESGQLDKAVARGETILRVDKNNIEAHLFLAEAYKRKGEIQKAKALFEEAKAIMKNPDFSKDLDAYMKTF
jgi:thioredoxin-like negative regulator of GroEL